MLPGAKDVINSRDSRILSCGVRPGKLKTTDID